MDRGAQSSQVRYRWMPMEAAAQALGTSVHELRLLIIHGALKSRITPAGIPQVLIGSRPRVPPPRPTSPPPDAQKPSLFHAITDRLRWAGRRHPITWAAVLLALALLLASRFHPDHAGAIPKTLMDTWEIIPSSGEPTSGAKPFPSPAASTTAPTTQEVNTWEFDPPRELPPIPSRKRLKKAATESATPSLDADNKPNEEYEEILIFGPPASFWESVSGLYHKTRVRNLARSLRSSVEGPTFSTPVLGADPNDYSVVLWLPNPNIQPSHAIDYIPFGTANNTSAIAAAFHLDPPPIGAFPSVGTGDGGDTGTPSVGLSFPPPISSSPEPSSAMLFGLGSATVLLRRRRST